MGRKPTSVQIGLLIFFFWTLVGLYFATQARYNPAFSPQMAWSEALSVNFVYYYLWGLFTPIVLTVGERYRFETGRWWRSFSAHVLASAVLTSLQIVIAESVLSFLPAQRPADDLAHRISFAFGVNFQSSLPTYWLILFVYLALDYYVKFRDRELRTSQLEGQLSRSQLQALRMQLQPHFLFNTLNSISSLMYSDVEAADSMLSQLSEFLRLTLDRNLEQEISLAEELLFVRRYLEIEKVRFEDRLTVKFDVDAEAGSAAFPTMALQPLIENAIHHGIAPRPGGGSIEIVARRKDEELHVAVRDDGAGVVDVPRERVGLANTRARLEQLYGADHRFSLGPCANGGVIVDIVIPFRIAEVPA
ncbi:MAG: histidine kinase [Acidobacteriota bacterium]